MIIVATSKHDHSGVPLLLEVRSNVFGALHIGHSISVRPANVKLAALKYKTVTDFLDAWEIHFAATRVFRLPFLKDVYGLGEVVRYFAEKFPLWVKEKFDGCEDRRAWLNWSVRFVPLGKEYDCAA